MPLEIVTYNPFFAVKESKKYTFARFFRRTLWEKIVDTFVVFTGRTIWYGLLLEVLPESWYEQAHQKDPFANIYRAGLIDYATAMLHWFFLLGTNWSLNGLFGRSLITKILSSIIFVPCSLLYLVSSCFNIALGGVLTTLALPFVGMVHLISRFSGGKELKERAGKLHVQEIDRLDGQELKDMSLENFLMKSGSSYSQIIISFCEKNEKGGFYRPYDSHKLFQLSRNSALVISDKTGMKRLLVPMGTLTAENKIAIKALYKLNGGGFYQSLNDLKDKPSDYEFDVALDTVPLVRSDLIS